MDRWSFNSLLFGRMSEVLEISGTEIARRCGLSQQVLSRYTTNEIVVSVQVLLKICNSLRMPSRFFISENGNHVIPARESATIAADCWQPVTWDSSAVEKTFGDGDGRIFWKDVAAAMGVTPQKPHERFLLRTRFPVTDFLSACSRLGISPFTFLVDGNLQDGGKVRRRGNYPGFYDRSDDVAALRAQVAELSAAVADLSGKFQSLLTAHEALSRRVSVNIENINSSYIGITAEPAGDK